MTSTASDSRHMSADWSLASFLAMMLLIALCAAMISFSFSGPLMKAGVHNTMDYWFDSDTQRVFQNLTNAYSDHYRSSVHPLSPLLVSTPTIILVKLGLGAELAARLICAIGASFLSAATFALCHIITRRIADSTIYTALLLSSSAFLFFATVPELYVWGGMSIVAAILSTTVPMQHRAVSLVLASILSFSFTVTNWMAGLAATALSVCRKSAVRYSIMAFALAAALVGVQSNIYPKSGPFLQIRDETHYTGLGIVDKIAIAPRAFFVDPIVFPGISASAAGIRVPVSISDASLSLLRWAAAVLWLSLLGLGIAGAVAACKERDERAIVARLVCLLTAGQLALHIVYGEGFFLYSLHYAPLLVLLAAFGSTTRWRLICLGATACLIGLAATNNVSDLLGAIDALSRLART